jgi:glycine dehydrogenase subunit 2
MNQSLLFEKSSPGRKGYSLPLSDVPEIKIDNLIPKNYLREEPAELPELAEIDVIRHYVQLSIMNHHVDKGFYPLGSCTMKYNPKINENLARLDGFTHIHPFQPESTVSGAIQIMQELGAFLCEIGGIDGISLQPAAGAQGEMTGIKVILAYHEAQGYPRKKIILPDSAHGTNPASATISGYDTIQIKSTPEGLVDIEDLKAHLDHDVAGFMLTNPNTLGLFESQVLEIAKLVHNVGAILYMDGANLNALLGIVKPGELGFDIVHYNLHKTFSTPHGGGGPGSGPIGVKSHLIDFLPVPVIVKKKNGYKFDFNRPDSIGKIQGFFGNFGVMIKAYIYIRMLSSQGLKRVSENAILNANYLMRKLENYFDLPHKQNHMHEFVISGIKQREKGIKTIDIAKRILDFNIHAPTVYFPLIVPEAMMIEPTETESKETLDTFVDVMIQIVKEAEKNPEIILQAPKSTPVSRLDEAKAARELNVKYIHI